MVVMKNRQKTDTGGAVASIQFQTGKCSLGPVLIAATEKGICAILFGDDAIALENDLRSRFPSANLRAGDEKFARMAAKVLRFIEAPGTDVEFPLDACGTDFQKRVWRALRDVAPGSTASYKAIAERIGSPKAVRAVAGACASNAIAVAIPCHRVVRSDGSVSGYRWGVDRKRALLDREAQR